VLRLVGQSALWSGALSEPLPPLLVLHLVGLLLPVTVTSQIVPAGLLLTVGGQLDCAAAEVTLLPAD
jgi:hypothetical protein